jgi:iron complex outermembrane recepter protein
MLPSRTAALLAGLAIAATAPAAHAQAPDSARADAVLRLGEMRVHGTRALSTAGGTSALEVVRDSLRLPAAPTLEDVLREIPMLHVRTNSRGEAEILARGSESRQVAVLVDGIPLTLNWDGRADVSVLPATAVSGLRFGRGLASMLHGPNVLGGVIELAVAGEHAAGSSVSLVSGYDHAGGYGGSATATVSLEPGTGSLLLRGGAGFRSTPGATLARGVLEPLPATRPGLRLNTDARSVDAFAAARYRAASGAWLSATTSAYAGERGIAAELDATAPRFWRYPHVARNLAVVSGGAGFHDTPFGGRGDVEFSVGYDVGRTEILAFSDRSYAQQTGFENGDDRTLTLRLLGDHSVGGRGDVRAAFTLADVLHDEHVPAGAQRYRQRLWSAGAESVWRLPHTVGPLHDVRISFGGARDGADNRATGDKPGVPAAAAWGARAGASALLRQNMSVHAGASRRARFPALREAFSGAIDRFAPNPDLGPEYLTAMETGVTAYFGMTQLQVVAFAHHLDGAIVRVSLPDRRFMRVNENATRSRGLEVLAARSFANATVGGDLTVQSARLITPSLRHGRLENQPATAGSLFARSRLPLQADGGLSAAWTGRQFCLASSGDDIELAAGSRISADLRRQFTVRRAPGADLLSRMEARLALDNLTNTARYDQCGLPQPGRLASLQIRLF